MSDFLSSFIAEEDLTIPTPAPTRPKRAPKTSSSSGANYEFRKKDNNIYVTLKRKDMADEEIVITPFPKTELIFLNKSVVFYGGSGSGKTTAIYNYMYLMRELFPYVVIFAPSEKEKQDFVKHNPKQLIYDEEFGISDLSGIYLRQKASTAIYNKANNIKVLHGLFLKAATNTDKNFYKKIWSVKKRAEAYINKTYPEGEAREEKLGDIKSIFEFKLIRFYKRAIGRKLQYLKTTKLSNDEKYAIQYLYHNPRVLVVFDDSTVELINIIKEGSKTIKGKKNPDSEVIKQFFYKGRWANITHFYAFHDDVGLDSGIRKNAFYSVFCGMNAALGFFGRSANSFSTADKKRAEAAINAVFNEKIAPRNSKLVYSRIENKFYYLVADKVPQNFKLCSESVRNFCQKVAKSDAEIDLSNPFAKKFESNINF